MQTSANFHLTVRKIANILLIFGFFTIVLLVGTNHLPQKQAPEKGKTLDANQSLAQEKALVESSCTKQETYECYLAAFKKLYNKSGPEATMTTLNQLSVENNTIKRDCHPYAHAIGTYAFTQIGDALKAFSYGLPICASGYYHGVMEGYLTLVRNQKLDLKNEIVNLCDAKSGDTRFMQFQCLHGLGHGLTMYFNEDIMKALTYCDSLKTSWDMESCYGGVFMENIVVKDVPGHKSLYLKAEEPEYPCNIVTETQKFSCYYLISSWFMQLTSYDFDKGFDLCDKVRSDFVWVCYQSMGRDISGATLRNPTESEKDCSLGQDKFYQDCIIGVVKDFTNTTVAVTEPAHFCQIVKNEVRGTCYAAAGQILHDIYPDQTKFDSVCSELTVKAPQFKRNCLQLS